VRYQLARCAAGRGYAQAEYGIIEAGFEVLQEVFACDALFACGLFKCFVELALQYTIGIFCLLLFVQLHGIFGQLCSFARLAMLSGRKISLLVRFIRSEDRLSEAPCNFGFWSYVSCHCMVLVMW
jgi:hypothetical protein